MMQSWVENKQLDEIKKECMFHVFTATQLSWFGWRNVEILCA